MSCRSVFRWCRDFRIGRSSGNVAMTKKEVVDMVRLPRPLAVRLPHLQSIQESFEGRVIFADDMEVEVIKSTVVPLSFELPLYI
ncbi:hypothetical protein TNCV_4984131 [Trichonephila clavipes]|nr:hypothetical protein TNCV_4984131 [Trichonephila clavipes]